MIALALLLAQAAAPAEKAILQRGSEIFSRTCAVAYCHGPQGSAGRAPQLAGRRYERFPLFAIINDGIPRTSMPDFKKQLSMEDLDAVVAYVMSLADAAPGAGPAPPPKSPPLPPEAKRGRELFFDPARLPSCGTCHLLDGWGAEVGPDVRAAKPGSIAALRAVAPQRLKTAQPSGEKPFPAVVVNDGVYDLTAALPVLRKFLPGEVQLSDGAPWTHTAATSHYSDEELRAILRYIAWLLTMG